MSYEIKKTHEKSSIHLKVEHLSKVVGNYVKHCHTSYCCHAVAQLLGLPSLFFHSFPSMAVSVNKRHSIITYVPIVKQFALGNRCFALGSTFCTSRPVFFAPLAPRSTLPRRHCGSDHVKHGKIQVSSGHLSIKDH